MKALYKNNLDFFQLVAILGIIFVIIMTTKSDKFLTANNFLSMMAQFPQYGLMAMGVMLAMIIGGIDLSVVATANLGSVVAAYIMIGNVTEDMSNGEVLGVIALALLAAVGVGILCGWFNGFIVSQFRIPAMLATIGTMEMFEGISVVLTQGKAISGLPPYYSELGGKIIGGFLPVPLLIFIIAVAVLAFMLNRTAFGQQIYMMGANKEAAIYSGLPVKALTKMTFIIGGILAAVAGIIMISRTNSAKADYGDTYTMQCIMIVILGGVNPDGGLGKVSGVVVSILIVQFISSAINMFPEINNFMKTLLWGCVLIAVVAYRVLSVNMREIRMARSVKKQVTET